MGIKELIERGTTETKEKKPTILDAEITMAEPPKRQVTKEGNLPSPFDAMYMYPTIDIKGQSAITTPEGEIIPYEQRKKQQEI